MKRFLLLSGFALAVVTPSGAAAEVYAIDNANERELGVVGGQVRLVKGAARGRDWELIVDEGTTTIRAAWGQWDGWYLAFDPTGKKEGVFLVRRPGPGTEWRLSKAKKPARGYTIQATEGKFQDWYLDLGGEAGELTDPNGEPYTAFKVKLSEKPRSPNFVIYPIGR